jgi:hypothetical protein
MKFELKPYNINASDKDLIEDLKKVALKLHKETITIADYKKNGRFSYSTQARRFDGWLKALEKAGLKKTRAYNITDEEWFNNLEEIWIQLGRQPYPSDMEKPLSQYSYAGYKRKFGGWRKALEKFVEHINKDEIPTTKSLSSKPQITKAHKTSRNISLRLRFIVMRRDDFKCKIDGRSPATEVGLKLEVDHIIPWDKGGETVLENLQTLCSDCNSGKSNLDFKNDHS